MHPESDLPQRRQLVMCVGPRCLRRARIVELLAAAETATKRRASAGWSLATYECLGRCATGPNALVRVLPADADAEVGPGYRELDDGVVLTAVDVPFLTGVLDGRIDPDRDGTETP